MFKETKDGQTHSYQDNCGDETHNEKCHCGKVLEPAKHCLNDVTKKWDGHTYWCPDHPKFLLSIG